MKLKVKKLNNNAILPDYKLHGDAGLSLYALEKIEIKAGTRATIATGIAVEIPHGYVGLIWDRGSVSHKLGLKVLGGVVDAGYRGDIGVGLYNTSDKSHTVEIGDKIAQMLIQNVELVDVIEVENLEESTRGDRRFGSTGR